MINKIKNHLRDLPLQHKLTTAYLLAFFLPLIFISFFTISRIVSISNDKAQTVRQTQCNQIAANIGAKLDEYYKSIYNFSSNQIINQYFDYEYENTSSFFSSYSDISKQLLYFRVSNPQIIDFTIYTGNPTFIPNGNSIKKLVPSVLKTYHDNKTKYSDVPAIVSDLYNDKGSYYFHFPECYLYTIMLSTKLYFQ